MTLGVHPSRANLAAAWLVALLITCAASAASSAPVVGFVENFPGTSMSTWAGGSLYANPGTGGLGGPGDGYLEVSLLSPGNLGTVSFGTEYAGNWITAGITQVRCWMTDAAGLGNLEVHLSISNGLNTWQQNAGIVPPIWEWGEYVVNMVAGDFTHNRGSTGTFADVMATVDRLHFRHDLPPYEAGPDPVQGAFGLDHILLTNGTAGVGRMPGVVRPVLLDPPFPNPARGRVTFQMFQPEDRPLTLSIFDALGRRVREVQLAATGAGPRLWMWDGLGDDGRAAPAGVYRVVARGDNGGMTRTVTLLR